MRDGPDLSWTQGNNWRAVIELPAGTVYEYKYVLLDSQSGQALTWQRGNNSVLAIKAGEESIEVRKCPLDRHFVSELQMFQCHIYNSTREMPASAIQNQKRVAADAAAWRSVHGNRSKINVLETKRVPCWVLRGGRDQMGTGIKHNVDE